MGNKRARILAVAAAAGLMVAAGCGSSSSSGSGSGGGKTYTVGILTDVTGPAASGNKTSVQGVQAGTVLAKRDGYGEDQRVPEIGQKIVLRYDGDVVLEGHRVR